MQRLVRWEGRGVVGKAYKVLPSGALSQEGYMKSPLGVLRSDHYSLCFLPYEYGSLTLKSQKLKKNSNEKNFVVPYLVNLPE